MEDRILTIEEIGDHYAINRGKANSIPRIRLKGRWLHEAGFKPGNRVRVYVRHGELVLHPEVHDGR